MLARLLRLLAPLTPRRRPRLFLTLRSAGRRPASSGRDASAPPPRHVRAPSVSGAVPPSPHSPNIRRRPAKKTGPSYLSPA